MTRIITMALAIGAATAAPVVAQERAHAQQGTEQHMDRMHELSQLMERMHATNEWMTQHRVHEQFHRLGRDMEATGERLRTMLQQCDQARATLNPDRDRDRLHEMDRVRDRLHDMQRELDRAHEALRKAIGQP
jgi:hypothetical protein